MVKKTSRSQAKSSKGTSVKRLESDASAKTFQISNELGLHARAAAQFVKIASRYGSEIFVKKDAKEVNGKSIMGILMLAAAKGSKITVRATGEDSRDAVKALGDLIDHKFGEE